MDQHDVGSDRFNELIAGLSANEHVMKEEFPALRRGCSEEQLTRRGKRLLAVEKSAPTRPHPTAAGSPRGAVGHGSLRLSRRPGA